MALGSCFHAQNREELLGCIPEENYALILFSGEMAQMSSDTDYRFLVDRNFFYLTGIEDPFARLIIVKREDKVEINLYVLPKDELKERWGGKRRCHEEFSRISGIANSDIYDIERFDEKIFEILSDDTLKIAYDGSSVKPQVKEFVSDVYKKRTEADVMDVQRFLTNMRMIKKPQEVEAIKKAVRITEEAIEACSEKISRVFSSESEDNEFTNCDNSNIRYTEYDLYTSLEYELARRGSLIQAFETIVSVDDNVFYLHHSEPEFKEIRRGDIIQLDLGARVDGYCADISRVYFVGRSDDEVKEERKIQLHELIVRLRREAFEFIRPGETFKSLNMHMREIVWEWLIRVGLVDNESLTQMTSKLPVIDDSIVSNYYWHNTSHHIGLDVHDVSDRDRAFEHGNCLAIEPGVYICEWGIGFRIEDDVIVTETGCKLLSSGKDDLEVL